MAAFRVNTQSLRNLASAIDESARNHEEFANQTNTLVSEMSADWSGTDYIQYKVQWQRLTGRNSATATIVEGLKKYAELLRFAADEYSKAQAAAGYTAYDMSAGPKSDIIVDPEGLRGDAQTLSRMNRRLDDVRAQAKHIKGRLEKEKDDPESQAAAARMGRIAGGWLTDSSIKSIPTSVIKALNDTADAFDAAEQRIKAKTEEFIQYLNRTTNQATYEEIAADVAESLDRMGADNLTLLAYYEELGLSKYISIDDDGTRHYNKEALRELLTRQNVNDVSEKEYAALIVLIDTMNKTDVQGNTVPDLELLEMLIDCGYTCTVDDSGPIQVYTYTPTPVFKALCTLYELHVDTRIRQNPALLYNEKPETALERQTLLSDMVKATLLSEMVATYPSVQIFETDAMVNVRSKFYLLSPPDVTKALGIKIWQNSDEFGLKGITAHEFSFENYEDILNKHEIDTLRSMRRDKEKELWASFGESAVVTILGLAAGGYSIVVSAASAGFNLANISYEVDEFNESVNEQEKNIQQKRVLKAMRAGLIITIHDGKLTVHGVCIDERELQIAVNLYNHNKGGTLDMATLEREFYKMGATGEKSDLVNDYVNWCLKHEDQIDEYKDELDELFNQYTRQYTDCPYKKLTDLNPEQINELDKKYKDKDYALNPEVLS